MALASSLLATVDVHVERLMFVKSMLAMSMFKVDQNIQRPIHKFPY